MIEVQIIGRTADDAPASVPSPDSQLHRRRDNPPPIWMGSWGNAKVFLSFDSDKFDFDTFLWPSSSCQESTRRKMPLYDYMPCRSFSYTRARSGGRRPSL